MKFFNFGKEKSPVSAERMSRALGNTESSGEGFEIRRLVSTEQFSKLQSIKQNIALNGGSTTYDDRRALDEICSEFDAETEQSVRNYVVSQ